MQEGTQGAFILFDIDDFKYINDVFGHRTGDSVIIQTANVLQKNMTLSDIAARWGGEELAVYLSEVSIQEGLLLAKQIIQQVSEATEPKITLSSGVSSWTDKHDDSVGELFARADKALYSAKAKGEKPSGTRILKKRV